MDCSQLVDGLLQSEALVSLFPTDTTGHPAIYQMLSPQAELFPRVAVFETTRAYTAWADDAPIRERSEYRLDLYARENVLREMSAALHATLRGLGFRRLSQVQDDYLPDEGIYVKSVSYEYYDDIMEE